MQAYEGYLENGQFSPLEIHRSISGRRRVIVTVLDEQRELEAVEKSENEKRKLLKRLCGSISDPSFVVPTEIPRELNSPLEEIV